MAYPLSVELREWQQKARIFAEQELMPFEEIAEFNGGVIPKEAATRHRQMAISMGLSKMAAPKAHGGLELSSLNQVIVWEQLGRVTNALCWCISEAHEWMFEACSPDQIARYIKPLMDGTRSECYAITEEDAGSDPDTIKSTAIPQGDHYLLSGDKWFVTSANKADYMFVQAIIPLENGNREHALFFVDMDSDGLEIIENPQFGHTFAAHHPTYRFHNVKVPAQNRVGAEGDGMGYTKQWFRRERLMIAARCCGAAARLIDMAADFAKNRVVSGQPIAEYQMIQAMLADSTAELWGARLMTYEAAAMQDRGENPSLVHAHCSMAKLVASEMANRVADRAVQIFGGRGYMLSNAAQRFYRELRVDRIWEGTSEIQRLIIARSLLKRGVDGLLG